MTFRQGRGVVLLPDELAARAQLVTDVNVVMVTTFGLTLTLTLTLTVRVGIVRRSPAARDLKGVWVIQTRAAQTTDAGQEGLAQDDVDPGVEGLVEAG